MNLCADTHVESLSISCALGLHYWEAHPGGVQLHTLHIANMLIRTYVIYVHFVYAMKVQRMYDAACVTCYSTCVCHIHMVYRAQAQWPAQCIPSGQG